MYNKYGYYYCMNYGWMEEEPLRLMDLGIEYRKNEVYDFDNRTREEFGGYLFQYTMDGCGYFETEDCTYRIEPGMAFLISCPDQSRYYLKKEENEFWEFFFLHFTGSTAGKLVEEIQERGGAVLKLGDRAAAIPCFFEEFEAIRRGKQYKRYESGEWLYHFLVTLLRDVETKHTGNSPCVNQALSWLQRNYASQENLSDLCCDLGVTLSHLSRQFRKEQGMTPEQYLINLRMQQAVNLLVNTSLKMNEIAVKCGFSCGNYFTKAFQKKFRMTPSKYREIYGGRREKTAVEATQVEQA